MSLPSPADASEMTMTLPLTSKREEVENCGYEVGMVVVVSKKSRGRRAEMVVVRVKGERELNFQPTRVAHSFSPLER